MTRRTLAQGEQARSLNRRVKRCAIYTRRSAVDRNPTVRSSLIQYSECIKLVERRGWIPVAELFDDDGWSGADGERPALTRLVERMEAGEIDQLVVYRVDRLTRSFEEWLRLGQVMRRFSVGLSVADGDVDSDSGARTTL